MTERYIADSAVFIMGDSDIDPSLMITVPGVADEMKSKEARLRFDLAREGGLRIEMPDPAFLEKVLKEAAATRDNDVLSVKPSVQPEHVNLIPLVLGFSCGKDSKLG